MTTISKGYPDVPNDQSITYNLDGTMRQSGHEGIVPQTIQYGPFGERISTSGAPNNNYLHYTGREEDPDTGLIYYRARYS